MQQMRAGILIIGLLVLYGLVYSVLAIIMPLMLFCETMPVFYAELDNAQWTIFLIVIVMLYAIYVAWLANWLKPQIFTLNRWLERKCLK